MLKLYQPQGGAICLGNEDLSTISHHRWRSICGVVLQDGYIFSDTILNNIAFGDDQPNIEWVEEAARAAQIDGFVEGLPRGYHTQIGRDGVGVSRGQSQRILIARALYRRPQYLFLDEATSALDGETEALIVSNLHRAMRGGTAVVIAHRLSTVRHAHHIVVLDGGTVAEEGTHDALISQNGVYRTLVRHQLGQLRDVQTTASVTMQHAEE
jgi:ATP-binding cassette subfamily B protein